MLPKFIRNFIKKVIDIIVPLIPAIMTLILPISIYKMVVPFFFRPDVYGTAPWAEPSMILQTTIYYVCLTAVVYFLGILSSIMMSLQQCRRMSWGLSAKYATFVISWLWLGVLLINTILLPFGKAYLLTFFKVPYSIYFVDGVMLTPFVLLGTIMARSNTSYQVCNQN
jgi:hypothetical protein